MQPKYLRLYKEGDYKVEAMVMVDKEVGPKRWILTWTELEILINNRILIKILKVRLTKIPYWVFLLTRMTITINNKIITIHTSSNNNNIVTIHINNNNNNIAIIHISNNNTIITNNLTTNMEVNKPTILHMIHIIINTTLMVKTTIIKINTILIIKIIINKTHNNPLIKRIQIKDINLENWLIINTLTKIL